MPCQPPFCLTAIRILDHGEALVRLLLRVRITAIMKPGTIATRAATAQAGQWSTVECQRCSIMSTAQVPGARAS